MRVTRPRLISVGRREDMLYLLKRYVISVKIDATPSSIVKYMGLAGRITLTHVKSHLQYYRKGGCKQELEGTNLELIVYVNQLIGQLQL